MSSLDVLHLGHPLLRASAQSVTDPQDPALQALIEQLLHRIAEGNGVGIAAPQVGISKQIVIVASHPTPRYPRAPQMDPLVMFNPQIVEQSSVLESGWEGCLSIPGLRGHVPRHQSVTVDYLDRTGSPQQQTFEGFVARIVQHEFDHLRGLLFIDQVPSSQDLMSEQEYQRQGLATPSVRSD